MRYYTDYRLITKTFDQSGNFVESGEAVLTIGTKLTGWKSLTVKERVNAAQEYLPFGTFADLEAATSPDIYDDHFSYRVGLKGRGDTYFIDDIEQDLRSGAMNYFFVGSYEPDDVWANALEFTYSTGSDDGYTHTAFLVIDGIGDFDALLSSADPLTQYPDLTLAPEVYGWNWGEWSFLNTAFPSFLDHYAEHAGTDGNDVQKGSSEADLMWGFAGNDTFDGRADDDVIYGDVGNDTLAGSAGRDKLYGGSGNDHLLGGIDADKLYGGNGHDYLESEGEYNFFSGGKGNDTLISSGWLDTMFGHNGNDVLTLYGGGLAKGGAGNDTLSGTQSRLNLFGNSGNDVLQGGTDSDKLVGGTGRDTLTGGDWHDTLKGGAGNDTLFGDSGNDILFGGAGDDLLSGDHGNWEEDVKWNSALGNDTLVGGKGADVFVYTGGQDVIADLKSKDTLVLAQGFFLLDPIPLQNLDLEQTQNALLHYATEVGDDLFFCLPCTKFRRNTLLWRSHVAC